MKSASTAGVEDHSLAAKHRQVKSLVTAHLVTCHLCYVCLTCVKSTSICIAHHHNYLKCAQTWITQFYLQITACLPLLPSRRASPPFGWYSFYRPTEGRMLTRPGWFWLHTEIKCRLRQSNPDTVTHPSTNRAQLRLTSLI